MDQRAVELHDEALRLKPEGATHDAELCSICVEKTRMEKSSETPPTAGRSGDDSSTNDQATEGGTRSKMADISQDTHEALLEKAVKDATAATTAELETAKARVTELEAELTTVKADNATLTEDNERLNGELDTAQITVTAHAEKIAGLEADIAKRDEDAQLAEVADARAAQVRNLKLFTEDKFIDERKISWAKMDEAAWDERVDEWKAAKGDAPAPSGDGKTEQASALSGTGEGGGNGGKEHPRAKTRSVLGLSTVSN